MSQNIGLIGKLVITCARVLGQLTYTPAHYMNGKFLNQKVVIPVRVNYQDKNLNKKKMDFQVTAWGPLADMFCRFANPGKAFDFNLALTQFMKKIYNAPENNGQPGTLRLDQAGQAIEVKMFGFQVDDFAFGDDSAGWVSDQISKGLLPVEWNKAETAGKAEFLRIQALKKRTIWDGTSREFLNARVSIPQGAQLVDPRDVMAQDLKEPITEANLRVMAWPHVYGQQTATSNQPAPQAPVYGTQQLPQAVGQVLNANPAPQAPVYANTQAPAQQGAYMAAPQRGAYQNQAVPQPQAPVYSNTQTPAPAVVAQAQQGAASNMAVYQGI